MRLLLDTHTFLWWVMDDDRLSRQARLAIGAPDHEVLFSAASAWEIAVKTSLGRLTLPQRPERFIPRQLEINGFVPLPLRVEHGLRVSSLPQHHRDPFDRLLIAQALQDDLIVVTADTEMSRYPIQTLW